MNINQAKHYKMFINTQDFLDDNTLIWSVIPKIVSYKNGLDDFNSLIGKPRNIQNRKYVNIKTIGELIDKTNNLLKLKMDNIMLIFKESNPEFYDGFKQAREIIN